MDRAGTETRPAWINYRIWPRWRCAACRAESCRVLLLLSWSFGLLPMGKDSGHALQTLEQPCREAPFQPEVSHQEVDPPVPGNPSDDCISWKTLSLNCPVKELTGSWPEEIAKENKWWLLFWLSFRVICDAAVTNIPSIQINTCPVFQTQPNQHVCTLCTHSTSPKVHFLIC